MDRFSSWEFFFINEKNYYQNEQHSDTHSEHHTVIVQVRSFSQKLSFNLWKSKRKYPTLLDMWGGAVSTVNAAVLFGEAKVRPGAKAERSGGSHRGHRGSRLPASSNTQHWYHLRGQYTTQCQLVQSNSHCDVWHCIDLKIK